MLYLHFSVTKHEKSDAIINALNAASLLQEFNRTALTEFFEQHNLSPLKLE